MMEKKEETKTNGVIKAEKNGTAEKGKGVVEAGVGEEDNISISPPDGGWGWAVVFASFMIHIIGNYGVWIKNKRKHSFGTIILM